MTIQAVRAAQNAGISTPVWDIAEQHLSALSRERAWRQELETLKASRFLASNGIPALVLKGPVLAKRVHGASDVRDPSADLDLLVDRQQLHRAGALLEELGWAPGVNVPTVGGLPAIHLKYVRDEGASLDLHWRVQTFDAYEHSATVIGGATRFEEFLVPSPEGMLSILLLAWARDGFHRLRLASDIAACMRTWEGVRPITTPGTEAALAMSASVARAVTGAGVETARSSRWQPRGTAFAVGLAIDDEPMSLPVYRGRLAVVALLSAPRHQRRKQVERIWRSAGVAALGESPAPWKALPLRALSVTRVALAALLVVARGRRIRTSVLAGQKLTSRFLCSIELGEDWRKWDDAPVQCICSCGPPITIPNRRGSLH